MGITSLNQQVNCWKFICHESFYIIEENLLLALKTTMRLASCDSLKQTTTMVYKIIHAAENYSYRIMQFLCYLLI